MKYYKLKMDTDRINDIVLHYENDFGMNQNMMIIAEKCFDWNSDFEFYYDKNEGDFPSDYLANDKGWFVVSEKLKIILENLKTDIQYIKVNIVEKNTNESLNDYYIANILTTVDALCLDKSTYYATEIDDFATVNFITKYAIHKEKTENYDVFKLKDFNVVPIFVSEKFANEIIKNEITGISLKEILVI